MSLEMGRSNPREYAATVHKVQTKNSKKRRKRTAYIKKQDSLSIFELYHRQSQATSRSDEQVISFSLHSDVWNEGHLILQIRVEKEGLLCH